MYLPSKPYSVIFFLILCAYIPSAASKDPGFQTIPTTARTPGSFSNGAAVLIGEPPDTNDTVPDIYGARDIDLPFYRLYHGQINFFSPGQLNTPTGDTDVFASANDNANQSACGIPDNAFFDSKVAIHPYFLKYADLSRYCMQDVCISFWKEDGSSDMMLKVTDICSTDPSDPTHCQNPSDIKIDRAKAKVMEGLNNDPNNPGLTGTQFPEKVWWFFMKCWDDGLAQPAYQGNNWFTQPVLPNNLKWAQSTAYQQYQNNQKSYPAKGWPTYPNGGYNTERDSTTSPSISDWIPGQEPGYTPIAGGLGWGSAHSMGLAGSSNTSTSNSTAVAPVSSSTIASQAAASTSVIAPPAMANSTTSLPAVVSTTGIACVSAAGSQVCWNPASNTTSTSTGAMAAVSSSVVTSNPPVTSMNGGETSVAGNPDTTNAAAITTQAPAVTTQAPGTVTVTSTFISTIISNPSYSFDCGCSCTAIPIMASNQTSAAAAAQTTTAGMVDKANTPVNGLYTFSPAPTWPGTTSSASSAVVEAKGAKAADAKATGSKGAGTKVKSSKAAASKAKGTKAAGAKAAGAKAPGAKGAGSKGAGAKAAEQQVSASSNATTSIQSSVSQTSSTDSGAAVAASTTSSTTSSPTPAGATSTTSSQASPPPAASSPDTCPPSKKMRRRNHKRDHVARRAGEGEGRS